MASCLNFTLANERGKWAELVSRLSKAGVDIEYASLTTSPDEQVSAHFVVAEPQAGPKLIQQRNYFKS